MGGAKERGTSTPELKEEKKGRRVGSKLAGHSFGPSAWKRKKTVFFTRGEKKSRKRDLHTTFAKDSAVRQSQEPRKGGGGRLPSSGGGEKRERSDFVNVKKHGQMFLIS